MRLGLQRLGLSLMLCVSFAVRSEANLLYRITEVAPPDGYSSFHIQGVSRSGAIVGVASNNFMDSQGYYRDTNGVFTPIPEYGTGGWSCSYQGINNQGEILCVATHNVEGLTSLLWDAVHGFRSFGVANAAGIVAYDLNDQGKVVFNATNPGFSDSYSWTEQGGPVHLESPATWTEVNDVSESGLIAGKYNGAIGRIGMVWNSDGSVSDELQPSEGHYFTDAYAINSSGKVAGSAGRLNADPDGFLWSKDSGYTMLGSLTEGGREYQIEPRGITESNVVIGSRLYMYNTSTVLVWSPDGGLQPLEDVLTPDSAFSTGYWVTKVASNGVFVGSASRFSGTFSYIAMPVPEPSTLAGALAGIAGFGLLRRPRADKARR